MLFRSHEVRGVVKSESNLIVIVSLRVEHGACRVHLYGVLLYCAGSVMLAPPVECQVTANFKAIVYESIVGTETSVGFPEITALYDAVMVKIADRE